MKTAVDAYFRLLKLALVLCLAGMVVLVFGNVVLRYAFNSGITVSEEVARLLFLYSTFLGAIVALREHMHIGVDSIVKRLPRLGKKACFVASNLLVLLACGLFLKGSWAQTLINLQVSMPVTGLSMGWVYGVGLVFSASAAVIVLHDLYKILSGHLPEGELAIVREGADPETLLAHAHPEQSSQPGPLAAVRRTADRAEAT